MPGPIIYAGGACCRVDESTIALPWDTGIRSVGLIFTSAAVPYKKRGGWHGQTF